MGRKLRPGVDKIDEKWVKNQVKLILQKYVHILVDMPPANMYGNAGRHDFIICQNGLYWTIETKAGKNNKASALQCEFAERVAQAGGISLLVNEFTLGMVGEVSAYISKHNSFPAIPYRFVDYKLPTKC